MKFLIVMMVAVSLCGAQLVEAKGGGRVGGGRVSSGISRPAPRPATVNVVKPPAPKPVTHVSDKPVVSTTGKRMSGAGTVVDTNNRPTFKGGYQPPVGSTVYYPQRDFMDYLPWIFLFTQNQHREVVVESKGEDGQVKQETHTEEGTDTMYVINWIVSLLLLGGLIYLIMRLISRNK